MKRAIKDRIDAIHQNPSSIHYIKTEIGILPCDWKIAKFSDIAEKVTQTTGTDYYETVSISAGKGFVNQAQKFGKELSGKQYEKYNVIHKGDFSYNKGNSNKYPQGCIYRLKDRETAAVPNVFESFKIQSECADFYDHLFVSGYLNQQLSKRINHGVRDDGLLNLTEKDFYSCLLPVPPIAEQKKISEILDNCDNLIKLCEAKVNEYKGLKKVCLSKIFPRNGSNVPELRFPEFTDAWERRKLTEFVDFFPGLTYTPNDVQENGTLVLRSSNVSNGEIVDADNVYVRPEVVNSENVKVGDIIVVVRNGSRSLIGKHAQIKCFMPNTVIGAFMTGIRSECPAFTNALLNTSHFDEEVSMNMGATINQITGYMFSKMEFCVPSLGEQKQIGSFFSDLDRLITLYQREIEEYTKLKKAMAQLLLTGIVRV